MATEFFDIKRTKLVAHKSCYYTASYRTDDGIVGYQKIACLNHIYALAIEDVFDFEYVSCLEFMNWAYHNLSYANSCNCYYRPIQLTADERKAIENFIVTGQQETGKFKITGKERRLFLNCKEYCIPLNSEYVDKSDLSYITSTEAPLYRILSKHTGCVNIQDEPLREPHPVLEDIGYPGNKYNFTFTCPVCKNKNSPAGYLGWPTKFYNLNKEYIRNVYNQKYNEVIINDPNIKDSFLFSYKRNLIEFPITYKMLHKIKERFFDSYYDYTFRDYCFMCKALGVDLDLNNIKTKEELQVRHDKILYTYQLFKRKLSEDKYNKVKSTYKNLFYDNDKYLIRYPEALKEIVEEGSVLHHCVGSYCDRVLKKQDYILFLREKSNPDTPFITINLIDTSKGFECKQAHGKYNCKISNYPEAEEFLNEWFKKFNIIHLNINKVC